MAQAVLCQRNSITHYFFTSFDPPTIYRQDWKRFSAVGYLGMLDQFFRNISGGFKGRTVEVYDLLKKCTPLSGLACISVLACHIFNVKPLLSPTPLLIPKKDPADPTARIVLTPEESRHLEQINQALRLCSDTDLNKTLIAFLILGVEPDVIAASVNLESLYRYLFFALAAGHEEMFRTLWALKTNLGLPIPSIQSLFRIAITQGTVKGFEILVRLGADIEDRNFYSKTGVVHFAVTKGQSEVIRELKRLGADLDAQDVRDETPTHYAARSSSVEILHTLKELGANPHLPNRQGETALHIAAAEGNRESLNILKEWGVDPEARDQKGWTPVHHAAYRRRYDILKMFGEWGVNLNAQDAEGKTAAHYLMEKSTPITSYDPRSLDYVRDLLEQPARISSRDRIELERRGMDFYLYDHKGKLPGGDKLTLVPMAIETFLLVCTFAAFFFYSIKAMDHILKNERVSPNKDPELKRGLALMGWTLVFSMGVRTHLWKRVHNAYRNAMRRWV